MFLCETCHKKTGCSADNLHSVSRGPCESCDEMNSCLDCHAPAPEPVPAPAPAPNKFDSVLRVRIKRVLRAYLASKTTGPYPNLEKALNELPTEVLFDLDALLCHVDPKGITSEGRIG